MSHRQTRIERVVEGSFPYWVCLPEEKCIGANFEKHREFCRTHRLALSKHGHAVVWQKEWYQVFRFATQEHAERFIQEFVGSQYIPQREGKASTGHSGRRGRI
jgi:hypothetical protein